MTEVDTYLPIATRQDGSAISSSVEPAMEPTRDEFTLAYCLESPETGGDRNRHAAQDFRLAEISRLNLLLQLAGGCARGRRATPNSISGA